MTWIKLDLMALLLLLFITAGLIIVPTPLWKWKVLLEPFYLEFSDPVQAFPS